MTPPTGNDETIIAYDATGRVVTETRGAGASSLTTTRTLDGLGREIETSNSLGEHSSTEFDELGRTIFNALPRLTGEPELGVRTEYDGLGRAVKVTQRFVATGHRPLAGSCATPNACETTQVITQGHCVDSTVSRAVNDTATTTTCFESFGDPSAERVASITDAKSGAWSYKYDIADNLTDFTAAMPSGNRSFRFAPGTFFPVSETTQARGTSAATAHDRIGNPTTRSDARGILSTFEYDDPLSRLTAQKYPAFSQESSTRTYEGHLLKSVSSIAGGSYTYEYDSLDRVVSITWLFQTRTYTTRYHYDPSGCLDRLTYPTGAVFVMTCDRAGRPTSIKQELSAGVTQTIVSTAGYNAIGRATSATYGNGRVVTTTFLNGRIDTIASPNVVSLKYVYDGADNVISVTDGQNPANNANPISYDKLDRLRTVATPGGSFDFDYDAMGNRLYADVPGQSRTTYGYNAVTGRLETSNGPQAPSPLTLSWSAGERIATSSDGATYVYDALGRRVRKTQPSAAMDVVFHYDASGHLLAETDVNGSRIREYVYLQGQFVATQGCLRGFSMTCQERAWVHTDLVGSVVAKSDANGAVARFSYSPFGLAPTGNLAEPRGFNGRWNDSGTITLDFGARIESPLLGRFWSADQAWLPSATKHANQYSFTFNNPYKYTDPSGNIPLFVVTGAIGGLVGGLVAGYATYDSEAGVNWAAVGGGVVAGAVAGATLGAAAAYVATGSASAGMGATVKGGAIGLASLFGVGSQQPEVRNRVSQVSQAIVSVYHKGQLGEGVVSTSRSLSTGRSFESVSALDRAGRVWEFRIPEQTLRSWMQTIGQNGQPLAQRLRDFDASAGVYNEELRFSAELASELQKFLVRGSP